MSTEAGCGISGICPAPSSAGVSPEKKSFIGTSDRYLARPAPHSEGMSAWTLSRDEFAATKEKIAKLNARAAKRGFTGGFALIGTPTTWSETDESGWTVQRSGFAVTLTGTPPCYEGWTFLAAVDTVGDDFVVRTAPGVPEGSIDRSMLLAEHCGHCKTARKRTKTFLVRHEDGTMIQVGSTCLKDFLGWSGNPVFYAEDALRAEIDGWVSGTSADYTVATILATAWAVVALEGFHPASFGDNSTRTQIERALLHRSQRAIDLRKALAPHMDDARAIVPTIIETLLERLGSSDFESNLRAVVAAECLPERLYGIAAAAIPVYQKMVNCAPGTPETDRPEPVWLGTKGEKVTVTGKINVAMTVDGYAYGTTSRLVIIETDTALIKVMSAAAWAYQTTVGDMVTVTGTVKDHATYRGAKQTVLARVKKI